MTSYVNKKMILEGIIRMYKETCGMYDKLARKSITLNAKNIFTKMHMDGIKKLESYEAVYNDLPDDILVHTLEMEFDMFRQIKEKRWCTREGALISSESIEHEVLSQFTKLKEMFPGAADDIIDDAIAHEERQLKFLLDVHNLQLANNIMI